MSTIPQSTAELIAIAPLHRFSTADYLEMIEKGVLGPSDHVELIGGVIVNMSSAGSRHYHFLATLNILFAPAWEKGEVWIQGTLIVADGQVYDPDFMLLRPKEGCYKDGLPDAEDVLLVIEAAESSMRRDQQIKLPVYAAAGIAEYWIADLEHETLVIHREPQSGVYRLVETRSGDDVVSPLATPEFSFAVRKAFE